MGSGPLDVLHWEILLAWSNKTVVPHQWSSSVMMLLSLSWTVVIFSSIFL